MAGLIVLGLAVGHGSTPLDDWFLEVGRRYRLLRLLLLFTAGWLIGSLGLVTVIIALVRRRWRFAAVAAVTPLLAVVSAEVLKRAFGREKVGELSYPSGHTTFAVVVLGLAVLAAGTATWAVLAAAVTVVLGALGQSLTYHYFTDTIGALLLGSALLCAARWVAGLEPADDR